MTNRGHDEPTSVHDDMVVSQALSVLDGDTDPEARRQAVETLGSPSQSVRDNTQQVVDTLIRTVRTDSNDGVRAEAINALYFLGDDHIEALVTSIAESTVGDTVLDRFSEWLTSDRSEFRMVGATAMSVLAEAVTPELESVLTDNDPRVQARAARAYGHLSAGTIEPIRPLLQAPDAHVRHAAVNALTSIGSPDAVEMLSTLLSTSDEQLRRIAVRYLYQLDREQSARLLLSALRDRSDRVQRTALVSLIRLVAEGQSVAPSDVSEYLLTTDSFDHAALAAVLHTVVSETHDEHVTTVSERYAIWLLGEFTDRVDDSTVLPWLLEALAHSDRHVADTAAAYLPKLDAPRLEAELQQFISETDDTDAGERAQRVLDQLRQTTVDAIEQRSIEYTYLRYPSEYTEKYQS